VSTIALPIDHRIALHAIEITVLVGPNRRGGLDLTLPAEDTRVVYATLADVRRPREVDHRRTPG